MRARSVLLYHPEEADAYARLVKAPRGAILLHSCATPEEASFVIEEAEILYAWNFPAELLARAGRLRWIQVMGAGAERFLVPELPRSAVITRAAGVFGPWMAEYTLAWCAWVTQRMEQFREAQRHHRWAAARPDRLRGQTLAVVGLGDIGREIGRLAHAFGMRVVGVSRSGRKPRGADAVYRPSGLTRAVAGCDFTVVTLPLTADTRGLIGERELRAMKPSAWLLNLGRGPVVQERALLRALEEGWIAGAILDVFDTEPLPADHPFWGRENVVVTPHIAGPSVPEEIAPIFNENLRRYLAGKRPRYVVDRSRGY
ncbi:MAG: D-2-hydroxyacid dehydrogenase [Candidatus Rokubacteria bacterium]|nr:D-2-hydroxyacid dehydrogenase [Candidatus Rokubacteria bacterium]